MANESSFYGDITFYHKGLEDTPENREKFKKIIELNKKIKDWDNTYGKYPNNLNLKK